MRSGTTVESGKLSFVPREHGATAMLLSPFVCSMVLAQAFRWTEVAALAAVALAFAAKDPLIALARQRLIWKQPHAEVVAAKRCLSVEIPALAICGGLLMWTGPWFEYAMLGMGAAVFGVLAVWVNVHNRQRSEWFQVASAVTLTSTSLVPCLAALGGIPRWGWLLWLLCALQATAGIFVVHARLDARIASKKGDARKSGTPPFSNHRATFVSAAALWAASAIFGYFGFAWITAALLIAGAAYLWELRRQKDPTSLRMPLTQMGRQSLALSTTYGVMLIVGLWDAAASR